MSVRFSLIKSGVVPESLTYQCDICFGGLMDGDWYSFKGATEEGVEVIYRKPLTDSEITSVRVFCPNETPYSSKNTAPYMDWDDEVMGWMRELVAYRPEVFSPVTIGDRYYEVSTNCSADHFWFCLNTLRILAEPWYRNFDLFKQVKEVVGVWKALILMGGWRFVKPAGKEVMILRGSVTSIADTCLWYPAGANEKFVSFLYDCPERLVTGMDTCQGSSESIIEIARIYTASTDEEDDGYCGPFVYAMQDGYEKSGRTLTFHETMQALEITEDQQQQIFKMYSHS